MRRAPVFPLRVSENGRYLVDRQGRPFLLHGDTMWMWSVVSSRRTPLSREGILEYLDDRVAKRFNTLAMISMGKSDKGVLARDRDGLAPFQREISAGVWDFGSVDRAYFDNLAWLIDQCHQRNLLVMIAPCWLGYPKTGCFQDEVVANGEQRCRAFGQFLGRLFGRFPNIIWIFGGDKVPTDEEAVCQHRIMEGLMQASGENKALQCAHWRRPVEPGVPTLSRDIELFAGDVTVEMTYPASLTYYGCLKGWHCDNQAGMKNPLPVIMGESYYEGQARFDIDGDGVKDPWPDYMCRRQAYWSLLAGAAGHLYGVENNPLAPDLNLPGTRQMEFVLGLFEGRAWYDLVPDDTHQFVTAGYGVKAVIDKAAANPPGFDYVAAARTRDGSLAMAYLPPTGRESRTITAAMGRLRAGISASWYNPATGAYIRIDECPNSGVGDFTSPGDNGSGQNDWVLILETGSSAGDDGAGNRQP
ncbi:MAG: DUF4038 domain-containing protein [Kiritimatiellae bacterium]|nr:DUF4038 domain-containing protein [Kiritimatiellia bacterium]